MSEIPTVDHRPRVAAERRERMRQRLVESAMLVFAEKGIGASVIQDVVLAAKVSQGTFYNYFRTNEELLIGIGEELNNELMSLIEAEVSQLDDPAQRMATGLRLYLHTARSFPLFARFVSTAGLNGVGPNSMIYEFLPPHIEKGIARGVFANLPIDVALDLIAGTSMAAIVRIVADATRPEYPEQIVATILRGLGLTAGEASHRVATPLPLLQPTADSLLVRSHLRFLAAQHDNVSK